jgi:hypothetical protein
MGPRKGIPLSTDLDSPDAIPYFLWDEPMTVAQFRDRLRNASPPERTRFLAKLLREARDTDVWRFVTPDEAWSQFEALKPKLGRRRRLWEFLLGRWEQEGLLTDLHGPTIP